MINRHLTSPGRRKTDAPKRPVALPAAEMALVFDEAGHAVLVPEDPRDIFNDPFVSFTEWNSDEDHKASDRLRPR